MAPVSSPTTITPTSPERPHPRPLSQGERGDQGRCKFRIRFRKAGDLRLVSHHDLMHVVERMLRRADLPIPTSQGFNPRPRIWFASALALGVAGLNEILEIEVAEPIEVDELQTRLARQCPPGIEILSVRSIDVKTSARVRRAFYRLPLPASIDDLAQRCETFLARSECWIERTRPHPRRVNVRPFVHELHFTHDDLELALWITPTGAARPEEVIAALGLKYLLDAGAVIDRTGLEIQDELPPDTPPPPRIEAAMQESNTNDASAEVPRPTAIVDNPMSFDS